MRQIGVRITVGYWPPYRPWIEARRRIEELVDLGFVGGYVLRETVTTRPVPPVDHARYRALYAAFRAWNPPASYGLPHVLCPFHIVEGMMDVRGINAVRDLVWVSKMATRGQASDPKSLADLADEIEDTAPDGYDAKAEAEAAWQRKLANFKATGKWFP